MTGALRVGFLLPAGNTTVEAEIPARLHGIGTAHFHRFTRLVRIPTDIPDTEEAIIAAAAVLRAAGVSALGLAYTAGSYYWGHDFDQQVIARMGNASSARATTAASAIVTALRALGVLRIGVVSPYSTEINERCEHYLSKAGFSVVSLVGTAPSGPASTVPPQEIGNWAASAARNDAEAVLISCTALRTLTLIDDLETSLSIPVVSSNSATLWSVLQLVSPALRMTGLGTLLRGPGAALV
jgi:maleate isomerase